MDSHTPFLAAIRAAPDDDAPRLVYADWLTENGEEERAEFVRRQVADPRMEYQLSATADLGSRIRAVYLIEPTVEPLPAWMVKDATPALVGYRIYHRGFVRDLSLSAADWLAHGDAILERHPVRKVRLTTWPGPWHEWMGISGKVIDRYPGGQAKDSRFPRWPTVAFELPPEPRITLTRPGDMDMLLVSAVR